MKRLFKSVDLTHYSLFIVSTYMSILMFIHIGDSFATKCSLGLLALIFEMTKLTDLKKFAWKVEYSMVYGVSYFFKALLSVIASVGLVLTLLAAQDAQVHVQEEATSIYSSSFNEEVVYWEKEISRLNETIALLNENIDRLPEGYGKAGTSFVNQIKALQLLKEEYRINYTTAYNKAVDHLSEASEEKISNNPTDMFNELELLLNIDSRKLRFIIFISIMVLIELSLALSVFSSDITKVVVASQENNIGKYTLPPKAFKLCMSISEEQREKEQKHQKLLTHKELAEKLNTTASIISNAYRRYLNRILKEQRGNNPYSKICDLITMT